MNWADAKEWVGQEERIAASGEAGGGVDYAGVKENAGQEQEAASGEAGVGLCEFVICQAILGTSLPM